MPQRFGRKLGVDPRLHMASPFHVPPHGELPSTVSYEYAFPAVFDQQFNDCVANAGIGLLEMYYAKRKHQAISASRAALYAQAKADNASGEEDMQDDGLYPTDALEVLKNKGWVLDHVWPYDTGHYLTPPPSGDWQKGMLLWSYSTVEVNVEAMKLALYTHGPLFTGWNWPNAWMDTGPGGVLPGAVDSNDSAGGHETVIVGYDEAKGFRGRNSWGSAWGDNGHFWVPFDSTRLPMDCFTLNFP